jgi:hypothetical protein
MPVAKIHVLEGQYNEARLRKVSGAVQNGLISALGAFRRKTSSRLSTFCRAASFVIPRRSWDSTTRMT